ncbi:MAG: hypothetical protein Q7K43_04550 [Candidatus Woesearchaeota archaeon]|nr:hypothetical protein [Candidatus Woesearchaeota archaeon]
MGTGAIISQELLALKDELQQHVLDGKINVRTLLLSEKCKSARNATRRASRRTKVSLASTVRNAGFCTNRKPYRTSTTLIAALKKIWPKKIVLEAYHGESELVTLAQLRIQ